MRIKNASFRRTSELSRLVDFVTPYCKYAYLARLEVRETPQLDNRGQPTCAGRAYRQDPMLTADEIGTPSLVWLGLNRAARYTRTQRLMARAPELTFKSWQEEFVAVLAHELRHIDQFWTGSHGHGHEVEAELDAELFALGVLNEYRTRNKKAA